MEDVESVMTHVTLDIHIIPILDIVKDLEKASVKKVSKISSEIARNVLTPVHNTIP